MATALFAAKSAAIVVLGDWGLQNIKNGVAIAYAFSYFFSPINGAFVSLWRFSGYHLIIFMAALQSISPDVEEAARVDGANTWHLLYLRCLPL